MERAHRGIEISDAICVEFVRIPHVQRWRLLRRHSSPLLLFVSEGLAEFRVLAIDDPLILQNGRGGQEQGKEGIDGL